VPHLSEGQIRSLGNLDREREAALRRAIELIERLLPCVMWGGEDEEEKAQVTLATLREALQFSACHHP
jgi:hypothetical protein